MHLLSLGLQSGHNNIWAICMRASCYLALWSLGLQSNGRTESILLSMPPIVKWRYDWKPETGSPEAKLYTDFLIDKNWI